MRRVGLRVDADTFRGTRDGAPRLLELFARHGIKASFFFSVGPDNMGRHLWRLLRPAFLRKMLRTGAPSLYGWDILLAGTAWPGRRVCPRLGRIIRQTAEAGHECGLHAWDHQAWQARAGRWSFARLQEEFERGLAALADCLGRAPDCSAAPGWRADQRAATVKEGFGLRYNSDCRGERPFRPLLDGGRPGAPQIPVSLPTFDEVLGQVAEKDFNRFIMKAMQACRGVPVYTVHTEVEGLSRAGLFAELLDLAGREGIAFCPLGDLLPDDPASLPLGRIERAPFPGREGWLGVQAPLRAGEA